MSKELYLCDPVKNTKCNHSMCAWNPDGEVQLCRCTTDVNCAMLYKGIPARVVPGKPIPDKFVKAFNIY